jgi:ABC-type thiamine transport system substrate-binding protein
MPWVKPGWVKPGWQQEAAVELEFVLTEDRTVILDRSRRFFKPEADRLLALESAGRTIRLPEPQRSVELELEDTDVVI